MKNHIALFTLFILLFAYSCLEKSVYASDFVNSIGMEFINISSGTFFMGSCKEDKNLKYQYNKILKAHQLKNKKREFLGLPPQDTPVKPNFSTSCPSGTAIDKHAEKYEIPQHKVRISYSFQIGKYEVTLGQFKKYIIEENTGDFTTEGFMECNNNGNRFPVTCISWNDAQGFINWLNKKENSSNYSYRLPTEAEWEYVARAGTTTIYSWGDDFTLNDKYASTGTIQAVGKKLPNPWGLFDMYGNVWEFVLDWMDDNYYASSPTTDPKVLNRVSIDCRVMRGGSWNSAKDLRSAERSWISPNQRSDFLGFRIVRVKKSFLYNEHQPQKRVKTLTKKDNFDSLIQSGRPCLVVFYRSDYCPPCVRMDYTIETLPKEYYNKISIIRVNVAGFPKIAKKFNVIPDIVPYSFLFKNGIVIKKTPGSVSKDNLIRWINRSL